MHVCSTKLAAIAASGTLPEKKVGWKHRSFNTDTTARVLNVTIEEKTVDTTITIVNPIFKRFNG